MPRLAGSQPRGEGVRIWSGVGSYVRHMLGFMLGKMVVPLTCSLLLTLCEQVTQLEGVHADLAHVRAMSWQRFAHSCSLPLKSHHFTHSSDSDKSYP